MINPLLNLPDFDYIALHGIWIWISDENRQVITDFIRKKLKVGGVLYISYNTQPGWATFAPMRHLMNEHANLMGCSEWDVAGRVNAAINFAEKLLATQPLFSRANPLVAERLQMLKVHSPNYLAHEYFNRDWCPMHFATMAQWLEGAKVHYACSAHYLSHIEMLNLTAEQQAFLNDIPDPLFRETTRDFMINQQFRRDYWVKGSRKLNAVERVQALRAQKVILTSHRPDVQLSVTGVLGEATMSVDVYAPLLDALADHNVLALGQLESLLQDKGINFSQIVEAIMVLMGTGHVALVQNDASIARAKQQTDKLNALLCHKALGDDEIAFLASPVTGGGIAVNRFQQLFLLSRAQGKSQPAAWAQAAWQSIAAQGQKLMKEGMTLDSVEENLAELTAQAQVFAEKHLPILKALQIA